MLSATYINEAWFCKKGNIASTPLHEFTQKLLISKSIMKVRK
jgi:hypothetical protein